MADGDEKQKEPRYTREEALARARAFTGQRSHIVAGALAESSAKTFTEAEIKKAVAAFVKRPENTEKEAA